MSAAKKRPSALQFLVVGVIVLILAAALIATSGVLAASLDPEPEMNSMHLLP